MLPCPPDRTEDGPNSLAADIFSKLLQVRRVARGFRVGGG